MSYRAGRSMIVGARRLADAARQAGGRDGSPLGRLALLGGLGGLIVALGAWLVVGDLPPVDQLAVRTAPTTTKLYDRHGRLLHEVLDPRSGRRTRVPLADVPRALRQAVVAVEDAGFYEHPGVDWRGVARALWLAAREGRPVSGGSTITQQLARTVLLSPDERARRSVPRKLREMWLALEITRRFGKDEVLELYLNEVYFGHLAYGVDAAARTYFGKPARQLDLAESALLAGLIQAPAQTDPLVFVDAAHERQRVVLDLMAKAKFISPDAASRAASETLHFSGGPAPAAAPHFAGYVLDDLERRLGPDGVQQGGLTVITTLDLDLQRAAEEAVRRHLATLNEPVPGQPRRFAGDAAVVALDPHSGDILAMVGSADYGDSRIDGAVNMATALRQPGSAFKPVTYAAAFNAGPSSGRGAYPGLPFTAATVLSDVPTSFTTREGEPYRPRNYDRTWHGPISLREALATSNNMVAVKVLDAVGLPAVLGLAARLGLRSLAERPDLGLALTLGGAEVTPLALTAAYGSFANGGLAVEPVSTLGVFSDSPAAGGNPARPADRDDRMVAGRSPAAIARYLAARSGTGPPPARVLPAPVAHLVTDILADADARVPAFGEGNVLELAGRPAAAKTGTTSDFRDNWTVGYTPDLVVGVWVGNADNAPMRFVSGISGAGPIWQAVMEAFHRGRPVRAFRAPPGLVGRTVCAATGLLATPRCPHARRELFVAGTEPRRSDDAFVAIDLDASGQAVWEPGCGGTHRAAIFRRLPADAAAWGLANGIARPPDRSCRGAPFVLPALERPWLGVEAALEPGRANSRSADADAGRAGGLPDRTVRVVEPPAGATFALVPAMDRDQQRMAIDVAASGLDAQAEVTVTVDGRAVCRWTAPPYRCFWPLAVGAHEVRAQATTLQGTADRGGGAAGALASAPVHFAVEPMVVEE